MKHARKSFIVWHPWMFCCSAKFSSGYTEDLWYIIWGESVEFWMRTLFILLFLYIYSVGTWIQKFLFSSFFYLYFGWFHLFHLTLKCYIRTLRDDFSVFTAFSHFWACLNLPVQVTYPLHSSFLSISENHLLFPEINYIENFT